MGARPHFSWQFKEATRLRIYNYVKTECGKTKTMDNFDTRQHMSVRSLEYADETDITAAVHTKYRRGYANQTTV
jgi:hypothetical protein